MSISKRPSEELFQAYLKGDTEAYATIRSDMEGLVTIAAKRYADQATEAELIPVGMTYFDFALEKYKQHRAVADEKNKPLYKFSTYYAWWVRESIRTYLGIAERPLVRIIPRTKRSA